MKTVIIISRCLKSKKNAMAYYFHFKGVYLGLQVNSLELSSDRSLKKGHDYVMRVRIHSYGDGLLKGEILYCQDLDDITSH